MDYVPKERRSRWKALQSIANFGWYVSSYCELGDLRAEE